MMNPEIKEKWVNALLSGEYEQGQRYLCNDGKYCCLGVLTDLYLLEHGMQWKPSPTEISDYEQPYVESPDQPGYFEPQTKTLYTYAVQSNTQREPHEVNVWAGLPSPDATPLAVMNDNGDSFAEIAEYIKENL